MAMVTLTNLSQTLPFEDDRNNLRTASFSSYLNSAEESFVLTLAESSTQNLSSTITTPQEHLYMGRKRSDGGEIGVFGAERYFNGGMEEETPRIANKCAKKYQYKEDEPVDLDPVKPKIQPGTPSVRSESSWNSQSALLQSVLRNPPRSKTNKVHGKRFLACLGCKCSCLDKNSVDIDEYRSASCVVVHAETITNEPIKTGLNPINDVQISEARSESWVKEEIHCQKFDKLGVRLKRENCFTFPILSSGVGNMPIKMQFQEEEDEKPRKSLEVFGSPILDKRNKSFRLEKRLNMSWDATPGAEEIEIPPDNESDASSDLFEIESLTGKATTCYAPSEASIEWSVVTASAADFSVMSDYEERRAATVVTSPNKKVVTTTTTDKEIPRRRPNILLGCKSQKAVRVAGDAYRTNDKPDSFRPVTRFQAEAKLIGFDSRHGQHSFATRLLPRSEPAPASHLLYIQ